MANEFCVGFFWIRDLTQTQIEKQMMIAMLFFLQVKMGARNMFFHVLYNPELGKNVLKWKDERHNKRETKRKKAAWNNMLSYRIGSYRVISCGRIMRFARYKFILSVNDPNSPTYHNQSRQLASYTYSHTHIHRMLFIKHM